MNITSAQFIKGVAGEDEILRDGRPQVAFVGRSNVGKSSIINSLTNQQGLAKTSSFPGRTRQINVYLINKTLYLLDLPGYGFAKASHENRGRLQQLIFWYLLNSDHKQKKVVLIVDANVGPTDNDADMLHSLEQQKKDVVVVANKIDKIKKSEYKSKLEKVADVAGRYKVIPFSAEKKIGVGELVGKILS
jgi:GTP-binding protein